MSGPFVLGLDLGTASTNCVVTDSSGHIEHVAVRSHRTSMPRPGWFEADPESHERRTSATPGGLNFSGRSPEGAILS
jgi:sugar (pentulose or hexulose) kinase